MDRETGMYYYGARYYDLRISIFISVDPLAEETMEPYLYTGNNPIMFTDPTGMSKEGGEHDYRLNRDGKLELIRYTKDKYDAVYNEENNRAIVLSKGVIDFSREVKNSKGEATTVFTMTNTDVKSGNGQKIFQFFADNSDVEFGYSEFKNQKTNTKFGLLMTSNKFKKIHNVVEEVSSVLDHHKDVNMVYNSHSHPQSYDPEWYHSGTTPSGFIQSSELNTSLRPGVNKNTGKPIGDRAVYKTLKEKYGNRIPAFFDLYTPNAKNINIKYNDRTAIRKSN